MKLLFIVPYPLKESPSQRFRFEQYLDILQTHGHSVECLSFLTPGGWRNLAEPGKVFQKVGAVVAGLIKRFFLLFRIPSFDAVFIHREAAPVGPPVIEWIIARVLK